MCYRYFLIGSSYLRNRAGGLRKKECHSKGMALWKRQKCGEIEATDAENIVGVGWLLLIPARVSGLPLADGST